MKHTGKENTTISLIDWKILMFDHKDVEIVKVIWTLFINPLFTCLI